MTAGFYGKSLGGRRSYQSYQAWLSDCLGMVRQVVAWRVAGCGTDATSAVLTSSGRKPDVRGYTIGQYRDCAGRRTREYLAPNCGGGLRDAVLRRRGGGPGVDRLTWDDALPGGGVGLRYTLATRNHVNPVSTTRGPSEPCSYSASAKPSELTAGQHLVRSIETNFATMAPYRARCPLYATCSLQ